MEQAFLSPNPSMCKERALQLSSSHHHRLEKWASSTPNNCHTNHKARSYNNFELQWKIHKSQKLYQQSRLCARVSTISINQLCFPLTSEQIINRWIKIKSQDYFKSKD